MKEKTRILLVDDEHDALDFLSYNLKKEGYEIYTASDGMDALNQAKKHKPELIVLDVSMPEMDGVEVCKELRLLPETKKTLIVFLTARTEEYSQVAGLDAGADDYIFKPIKPRLLISRINALLRRRMYPEENIHRAPAGHESDSTLKINHESYSVTVSGKEHTLPKREFQLLALLASKPGTIFSREFILNTIWGEDASVDDRTVDVHIQKLRKKIGNKKITTLRGMGYKIEL
ncbi:MAG TPA: response regulator transcription factor [Bacteroidia bacterium]|nr:response regulator transcription factor [Bacteroidia bacterium]